MGCISRGLGLFLLAAALSALCAPCAEALETDPAVAIQHIGDAIENADIEAFQRLVDLDALIDDCMDVFFKETAKPENASRLPPLVAIIVSRAASGPARESLRPLLRGEARAFVLNGIGSGAFAGKKSHASSHVGVLAPLFANASPGRKEIRGIGEPQRDGEDWIVPFMMHDYGNGQDYPIAGRLSSAGNGWRLTGIKNFPDIIGQIYGESQGLN